MLFIISYKFEAPINKKNSNQQRVNYKKIKICKQTNFQFVKSFLFLFLGNHYNEDKAN